MNKILIGTIILVQLMLCGGARSETAIIATASNFRSAAEQLEAAFEQQSAHDVTLVSGATGMLLAQTTNGAPFDVFLSADQTSAARLVKSGKAVEGTRFTYAGGRLVLISMNADAFAVDPTMVLRNASFRRLAFSQPTITPYGAAATDVIEFYGLDEKLNSKYAIAQNVGQAYAFVVSGNAELGFVSYSFIADPETQFDGAWWEPPQEAFRTIRQDAVLLTRARDNKAARAFLDFLRSPAGVAIIETSGYRAPE